MQFVLKNPDPAISIFGLNHLLSAPLPNPIPESILKQLARLLNDSETHIGHRISQALQNMELSESEFGAILNAQTFEQNESVNFILRKLHKFQQFKDPRLKFQLLELARGLSVPTWRQQIYGKLFERFGGGKSAALVLEKLLEFERDPSVVNSLLAKYIRTKPGGFCEKSRKALLGLLKGAGGFVPTKPLSNSSPIWRP